MVRELALAGGLCALAAAGVLQTSEVHTSPVNGSGSTRAPKTGACCFDDGTCQIMRRRDCDRAGGQYLGNGTSCAECEVIEEPTGACCLPDGACQEDVTAVICNAQGGIYQGDDTTCADVICEPLPTGACCIPDFTGGFNCVIAAEQECFQRLGEYQGDGTVCDEFPCGPLPLEGACCVQDLGDPFCIITTELQCALLGGQYFGDLTFCEQNICGITEPGACCLPDGSCTQASVFICGSLGGSFQGVGTICPTACEQ